MNNRSRLSSAALICMLLSARIFAVLTFFPRSTESGFASIIGILLSTAVQGLLIFPVVRLVKKTHTDPLSASHNISSPLEKAVTAAFLLFFLYDAFLDIGSMAYFTDYFFSVNMPRALTVACCLLTALYAARLDSPVIGRLAQLSIILTCLMLLTVAAGSAERIDVTRFDLAIPHVGKAIFHAALADTGRCECLVIFSFYAAHTNGDAAVTARRFLIAKGTIICTIFALVTAVLGSLSLNTPLPVFTLAATSENLITERCDALFLLAWIFTGLVKLANLLHCAAICVRRLFPKATHFASVMSAGILPAAAALPLLLIYKWESIIRSERSIVPIIVLTFILPLILLRTDTRSADAPSDPSVQNSV